MVRATRVLMAIGVSTSIMMASAVVVTGGTPAGAEAFPGANGRIAFVRNNLEDNNELWTMRGDGSEPALLLDSNKADTDPAWSPDGTKVAFAREDGGDYEIFVMDADGTNVLPLTAVGGFNSEPSWSPDGTKIAFSTDREGAGTDIFVMDADGTNPLNLTDDSADGSHPSWSPDGTKIGFARSVGSTLDIFVMDADGSNAVNVTQSDTRNDTEPSWSPDGSKLVFESSDDLVFEFPEIYVIDADGSNQAPLTDNDADDGEPVWSPDGSTIAFTSNRDEDVDEIYLMNADGSDQVALTSDPTTIDHSPTWEVLPVEGALFTAVDPARILDSRLGTDGPWGTQEIRDVVVTGGEVPEAAVAVALNVTVTGTTASSNLRIWPKGLGLPTVSSLNWQAGWTVPNAVTVKVGDGNQVSIYNNNGQAHVVIDVVGYYAESGGAGFTALDPERILDSRPESQEGPFSTPWGSQETREVTVAGVGEVPADVDAVVLNVTVTGTTASSNLRIWPTGPGAVPTVSSLNWQPGWTIPNAVTVKVGAGNSVNVYNNNGQAHVVIDVVGYFDVGAR